MRLFWLPLVLPWAAAAALRAKRSTTPALWFSECHSELAMMHWQPRSRVYLPAHPLNPGAEKLDVVVSPAEAKVLRSLLPHTIVVNNYAGANYSRGRGIYNKLRLRNVNFDVILVWVDSISLARAF
ncbi:hypothetical protein EJ05DRAFT_474680 [Pseudovirgaria hyperparasitica]|uniref:Uncharacterized protein n=1 Tax=Pseudovirgaria hyperparasitica TaxID=470096 RepID=A0A6A6WBQ7_9PEZI|nr:uncharacterized protein EJ05DRAFT_474680 [Pseudovirgaria hyperparasitica]KAF2759599.1 hypothetical protein EJ05DRAFT_474680 [Pseudovirgaria hyperparasitica]